MPYKARVYSARPCAMAFPLLKTRLIPETQDWIEDDEEDRKNDEGSEDEEEEIELKD